MNSFFTSFTSSIRLGSSPARMRVWKGAQSANFLSRSHVCRFSSVAPRLAYRSDWDESKSRTRGGDQTRRSPVVISLLILMPVISFGLGTWQVKRLKWKQNLISSAETHLMAPPIDLPANVNPEAANSLDFSYRRVRLVGEWDHAHEMLVGPRIYEGRTGYYVVTPLKRKVGKPLLVQRGWISKEMGDNVKLRGQLSRPTGPVQVLALMQVKPKKNMFTPDSNPNQGMYHFMDIDTMAKMTDSQPIYLKEIFNENSDLFVENMMLQGIPIGVPAKAEFRNTHFQYILTWYGLSLATTISLFVVLKQRRAPKYGDHLKSKLEHAKRWQ